MKNILIVGVGGQGSLLASRILGDLFMSEGLDVRVSEVHGMAQRGGSVVTYVRAGTSVSSPIIPVGEADIIIAFEQLEALRWIHFLKKDGKIIYSTQKISPMPVITGAEAYPEDIRAKLSEITSNVTSLDALSLAVEAGTSKACNIVLLGAAAKFIEQDSAKWKAAIEKNVKPGFFEVNLKAFELGMKNA